jgi:hypothetical protein
MVDSTIFTPITPSYPLLKQRQEGHAQGRQQQHKDQGPQEKRKSKQQPGDKRQIDEFA